jgi:hypothetical protein
MWGDCTRGIYMPHREPPIRLRPARPEGIGDPRLEGRGGHQHDGDFFNDKEVATLDLAAVHHGPWLPAAEKASIDAYATSWARGLGLLDEE